LRVLGWEADEIIGRASEWLEHPDDRAKTRAEVRKLEGGASTTNFENRFRRVCASRRRWRRWAS
jgi:PAS domain-containing protein